MGPLRSLLIALALVAAVLTGLALAPWEGRGRIQVWTVPADATVTLDGVPIGDRSPLQVEAPSGRYRLEVRRRGYVSRQQSISVQPGQTVTVTISLESWPAAAAVGAVVSR
jgi:hypothetical protein